MNFVLGATSQKSEARNRQMVYLAPVILFIAALVQSVVLPQAVPISVRPNFVVLLVVSVCLVEGLYDAIIWGFVGGIMLV